MALGLAPIAAADLPFTDGERVHVEAEIEAYIAIHNEYDIRLSAGHALPPTKIWKRIVYLVSSSKAYGRV